jgi:hypothetical protein
VKYKAVLTKAAFLLIGITIIKELVFEVLIPLLLKECPIKRTGTSLHLHQKLSTNPIKKVTRSALHVFAELLNKWIQPIQDVILKNEEKVFLH